MKKTVAVLFRLRVGYVLALALLGAYLATSSVFAATKSAVRTAGSAKKTAQPPNIAAQATPATLIGVNVNVNNPSDDPPNAGFHSQSESAIAVNPISGTICVGFNDFLSPAGGVEFASSSNDGSSFQDHGPLPGFQTPGLPNAIPVADPAIFWRRFDGKFYMVTVIGFADSLGLWVSNDDCQTFTPVSIFVPPGSADKPMIAVDNDPASSYYGRAYAAWKGANQRTTFSYSDDMATWSSFAFLGPDGPQAFGAWPVVAPGGKLYVFWSQINATTFDIKYVSSTSGGNSFSAVAAAVSGLNTPYNAAATSDPTAPFLNGNVKSTPFTQVAIGSDSCLHMTYPVGPNSSHTGDCSDVYYRRSCDGGTSWTAPFKVNDDGTATDQWSPTISVGPGGLISIAFYDRRNSTANLKFEYYDRVSINNGTTFQTSTRISSTVSPVHVDGVYHGDYDMQAQRPGALYLVWSDDHDKTADGQDSPDVFFQKACLQTGCTIAPAQPRQVAPLSGSRVTSRRPNFKVKLGNGATGVRVDVCRDRACTNLVMTMRAIGSTVTPTSDLPTGMLFWRAYGTSGLTDGLAPSATWEFRVTALNSALVKSSWGAEPDYNGDGRADAAFSARDAGGGVGKVYVYNSDGSAAGIPASPTRVLNPPSSSDTAFGQSVSSAGDLNGDGFADLVVWANHAGSGVLYVYYGSPSGIATHPAAMISSPSTSAFGRPQAAGDINGDGYADLLATDAGYQGTNTYGRAYTYFGGPAGLPATPSQSLDPPASTAYYFYGFYDGSVGDVNGDGYGDVVVAAYSPVSTSATYLYLGGTNGLRTPTQINASNGLVIASQGIAFGDVNADGLSDVTLASQPSSGSPVVVLYAGSTTAAGGFNPTPIVYGNAPGTMHDADTNNDGFDDLIMAVTASSSSPGVIYVYAGGALGYFVLPSSTTNGPDGNNSGWANALEVLGDLNSDGLPDVGVGAVLAANNAGKFYVYRGTATGLAATAARTLTGGDGASSLFGAWIAGIE